MRISDWSSDVCSSDLKPSDEVVMASLDKAAVSYQAVLTKADKAGPDELERIVEGLAAALRKRPAAHPEIIATSVVAGAGVAEQLGRAAWRERVVQYGSIWGVAGTLKKNKNHKK